MYSTAILAVSGLVSLVAAVPMAQHEHHHHQRDYVWVTETEEAIVTVPVTQTVWVNPGEAYPATVENERPTFTSRVHQTVTVPSPSPESSSSSAPSPYVAPTTSSTSEYVAPSSSSTSVYVPPPAPTTSSTSVYVAPAPTSSSTSEYVAPPPSSTSVYVAPAPTTTAAPSSYVAPSSSSAAPAQTSAASSSGSGLSSGLGASGTSYTGDLTWYDVGLGACGWTNSPSDPIVAISHVIFESYGTANPNNNPLCGKTLTITGKDGNPYTAKIVDKCPGCAEADLDLSQDFFNKVTSNGDGRVHNMKWTIN